MDTTSDPAFDDGTAAARGDEVKGLAIYDKTVDNGLGPRGEGLIAEMTADQPTGGTDLAYGKKPAQHLRYWKGARLSNQQDKSPLIVFVHGGSWQAGTHLSYIGAAKVSHLVAKGYAFATVNYTLVPDVTVEEQVQEVADALAYLVENASDLDFDPARLALMGHSSGAHVVTLLGTDTSYLDKTGVDISDLHGVIALDGSNYNAAAELINSPGPVVDNMIIGLGTDPARLAAMSPTFHAHPPNARSFLLLHVQRSGDIRQAVELSAALKAAGTDVALHVFEGQGFEGHMQMLLRLGKHDYGATSVLDKWLATKLPIT